MRSERPAPEMIWRKVSINKMTSSIWRLNAKLILTCLPTHLSIYTCLSIPVYLPTCLYIPVYLSTCLSIPVYLPTCLYAYLYIFMSIPVYLYTVLVFYLSTFVEQVGTVIIWGRGLKGGQCGYLVTFSLDSETFWASAAIFIGKESTTQYFKSLLVLVTHPHVVLI